MKSDLLAYYTKKNIFIIDCHYIAPQIAASFIIKQGNRAIVVESNTPKAVPRIRQALQEQNITPENVDYLIVTHVHLDHSGGTAELLKACPQAKVLVHPKGARHLNQPKRIVQGATAFYGKKFFDQWYGEIDSVPKENIRTMENGETLEWNGRILQFIHTAGHASHHMSIYDKDSKTIFTGDAFGTAMPNLQRGTEPFMVPAAVPPEFDLEQAIKGLEIIANSGAEYAMLTHFGPIAIYQALPILQQAFKSFAGFTTKILKLQPPGTIDLDDTIQKTKEFLRSYYAEQFTLRNITLTEQEKKSVEMEVWMYSQGIALYISRQLKHRKQ